ncbi:PIG-L family deacetylase [Brevibacillus humidisoli]|uniref:PIG-L deacetylase family protein n=1 Tax=Brevibacillus humidisoli TaxID=2895522 RepID=UPI001E55BCBF|nr:PIG-L family deacetylase [Brevibacillus humidisoli]UFJ39376.1 PIG-L family deacetylase [Brevibacillus humidisoli]
MKKLLFLFPHPDDESFACAGTLAKYHEAGEETYLVCATSGCKGKSGPFQFTCREELASHREQELRQAASILGITETFLYRYPDGSLADQDFAKLTGRIAETLLAVKPNVVVTFPPDGVTGHPDHITLSKATVQAVLQVEPMLHPEHYSDFYFVSIPHYYDHCQDKGPQAAVPITGKVDISPYRQTKGEALRAHQSQAYSLNRAYPGVLEGDFSVIGNYEYYTLVRSKGKPVDPQVCAQGIRIIEL